MILNDREIKNKCLGKNPMIMPFNDQKISLDLHDNPIISRGLSSAGYDIACEPHWKVFSNHSGMVIDPKNLSDDIFIIHDSNVLILPPNNYALGCTKETFNIPDDILCTCVGKSTYARVGISVNVTPIEPGWRGQLVVEIANNTNSYIRVYANEGIAQLLFHRLSGPAEKDYQARGGKYQDQTGITDAKV